MKRMNSQKGQALVLIALAAVGLFGFAALAIDGSRAYSDKRHAQNTADTAALAAALAYLKEPVDANKWAEAYDEAIERAASNGYTNNGTLGVLTPRTNVVIVERCSTATRACDGLPSGADKSKFIRVYIVSYLPTTFARILGRPTVTNAAEAITMVSGTTSTSTAGGGKYGLQTLKQSCGNPPTLDFSGSGDVTIQGSIGNNSCFDASGSGNFNITGDLQNGGDFGRKGSGNFVIGGNAWVGKFTKTGSSCWDIAGSFFSNSTFDWKGTCNFEAGSLTSVVTATKTGSGNNVLPWPGALGAAQTPVVLDDPYAAVLNPPANPGSCATISYGGATDRTLNPGCYVSIKKTGSGDFTLNPGIYYILGDFDVSGSGMFTANGVLFYMQGGTFNVNGSGGMSISPYTADPYKGLSIYVDRSNNNPVEIIGSGGASFAGTVYAPASAFTLTGSGGTFVVDSQILSYTADLTGSGNLNLIYNPDNNFNPGGPDDPSIQLIK